MSERMQQVMADLEGAVNKVRCMACGGIFTDVIKYLATCPKCQSVDMEKGWTRWCSIDDSSMLVGARFRPNPGTNRGELELRFHDGSKYRYSNIVGGEDEVPTEVFLDLVDPGFRMSRGAYFHKRIKGIYSAQKVEER
jgi:hypothetical protein